MPRVLPSPPPLCSVSFSLDLSPRGSRKRRLGLFAISLPFLLPLCHPITPAITTSFAIERAFSDQLLMPRGEISAIHQVHHSRISPDFMRLAQFFYTAGVYGAAEFRFTSNPQVVVLAEARAFQRRAAPGISHVSTVVVFNGKITAFDPARQAAIKSTLYRWGRDLAADWDRRLTRHGDECYPVDGIEVNTLRTTLRESPVVLPELAPFQPHR